jgi:hypothetical protein
MLMMPGFQFAFHRMEAFPIVYTVGTDVSVTGCERPPTTSPFWVNWMLIDAEAVPTPEAVNDTPMPVIKDCCGTENRNPDALKIIWEFAAVSGLTTEVKGGLGGGYEAKPDFTVRVAVAELEAGATV